VFNELEAYYYDSGSGSYVDAALTSTVTASKAPDYNPLSNFIDGVLSTYVVVGSGTQWIKCQFTATRTIPYLILQMYYADGRTFHNVKIEYSTDDVTYTTLYNTAQAGEKPEKVGGMMLMKYAGMAADTTNTIGHVTAARAAGLKIGFTWFNCPNYYDSTNGWLSSVANAETQATTFYNYIVAVTGSANDIGDIMPMFDFENANGSIYPAMTNDQAFDFIEAFLGKFKQLSKRQCILYTAFYCVDNLTVEPQELYHSTKGGIGAKCPLMLACYSTSYPSSGFMAFGIFANNKWTNWQYQSSGSHGAEWGVNSTNIDLDVLEGDLYTILKPSQVTGLTATVGDTQIILHWTASPDTDKQSYFIYKDGVYLSYIAATTTTFTATGLTNGTSYSFQVAVVDFWETGNLSTAATATPAIVAGSISSSITCYANVTGNFGEIITVKRTGMHNGATKMFQFGSNLYILTGTEYLVYDGSTVKTVAGYVPLLAVGVPPAGGTGTVTGDGLGRIFEELNILTGSKHETFSPNGTSADFYILEQAVTSIDYVKKNGITLTLTTDYTVDLTLGKIHFVVIPVTGTPSNVDIGWTKGTGQRTLIENCLYEMDYSGQTDSRVFLWGNTNFKNRRFWSGLANGVPSAEYFESNSYDDLGTGEYAITDIIKQLDRQKIFFELGGGAMYSYYSSTTDVIGNVIVSFPVFELNENIGNMAFGQVQVVADVPYTINNGVYAWQNSTVRDQTNSKLISQRVQQSLNTVDLTKAITYNWQEQKEYWLCIGSIVWVHNYFNDTWYKFDNITASYFLVVDGQMYYGAEGSIYRFNENLRSDNNTAMNINWTMAFYDFGADWRLKFMNKAWISINPNYRSYLTIKYITNNDGVSDSQIVEFNVITFTHLDFAHFSFRTSYNPQPYALELTAQQFVYFKFVVEKLDTDTTVTILSINMLARLGGKVQ
jgi:hypothetical protein